MEKEQLTLCPVGQCPPEKGEGRRSISLRSGLPAWLGAAVANDVRAAIDGGGGLVRFAFSRGERKIFRRRRPIPVSEWAEKYRVLMMSSIPGRWKNLFTPYLAGIMDAMATRGVETVIICKAPQTGGSEAGHNFVGWCVDRCPGPVMYVFPDEITARENAKDRIIPMLEASPRLSEYMTGMGDDASSLRINLVHMPIYLAWSGSVSRLGNKPIRTLILDELDKYKDPKNEASSEALAEKRTITWRTRRHIVKISTPTVKDGPIWRAFTEEAQARFDYHVRCPHCGFFALMKEERIDWPGKGTDAEIDAEDVLSKRLATYSCEFCGAVWDDSDRDRAVRAGEWRERTSGLDLASHLASRSPQKVGFHIPAWLSFFVSLSDVARAAIRARRSGLSSDARDYANQYRAEPWEQELAARGEDSILALCDDRPRGAVPGMLAGAERISCLLAGVDTQKSHFRYVIRAYGYGELEESWLIQSGTVDTLDALDQVLWQGAFFDAQGRAHQVRAAMIDAMGSRTAEIYRYAIRHRGRVYPWQGVRSQAQPYTPSPQEYFPDARGGKVRIPGGMNLWRCDVSFFKNDLAHKLEIHPDDPGAFHLHSNSRGELMEYAREMCAEVWDDEEGAWVNPHKRPNHFWDCEVMVKALAYILGVRQTRRRAEKAQPKTTEALRGDVSIASRIGEWRR